MYVEVSTGLVMQVEAVSVTESFKSLPLSL